MAKYASAKTIDEPRVGGLIWKVVLGLMFIAVAVAPDDSFEIGARAVGFIMGAGFVAWGVIPYAQKLTAWRAHQAEQRRRAEEQAAAREAELHKPRKCPNCGGISPGPICDYCGLDISAS